MVSIRLSATLNAAFCIQMELDKYLQLPGEKRYEN
jgi:hypothetical protein